MAPTDIAKLHIDDDNGGRGGTGQFLSKPWKNPGDEYPAVPFLLDNTSKELSPYGSSESQKQYKAFQLQQGDGPPVSKTQYDSAIEAAKLFHDTVKSNFMGYQVNFKIDYSHLAHYLHYHVNNLGDPFLTGNCITQTKFMERAVLDYFAALWNAEWPHDCYKQKKGDDYPVKPLSYWGFVLSMGCTEGTMYGLWNGRDYLSGKVMLLDKDSPQKKTTTRRTPIYVMATPMADGQSTSSTESNDRTPLCFFSEDSHYSLSKSMVILNIQTFQAEGNAKYRDQCPLLDSWGKRVGIWPEKVPSNPDGTVNVDALVQLVEFFAKEGYPPLICFNFGTTFKGSYDDVEGAATRLFPILKEHNLLERDFTVTIPGEKDPRKITRNGYWFHVDGALGAAYIPYLKMAQKFGLFPNDEAHSIPKFDFSLRWRDVSDKDKDYEVVQSIAVSGHKWIGAPFPTGLYMTKSKLQLMPPEIPVYVGTPDTTFAGSRNGFSSVILWDYLAKHSFNMLMEKAVYTQNVAEYLFGRLNDLQENFFKEPFKLHVTKTKLSLSVIFRQPKDEIVIKYSLSKEIEKGIKLVHCYAMEHVTMDTCDNLIEELKQDGAFENY